MGQKIIWFCDLCAKDEIEHEGAPITLVLNGKTVEADLCDEHSIIWTNAFEELARLGRVTNPPREQKPRLCPDCEASYSSGSGLLTHRRKMHGYVSKGHEQVIDLDTNARRKGDLIQCPVEGCEEQKAWGPGMHAHLRSHARNEDISLEQANELYATL